MVRFIRTAHLGRRLAQRKISYADVEQVLRTPGATWFDPSNQSQVYLGTAANGKTLKIAVVDPPGPDGSLTIKTAMWLEKERP